MNGYLLLVIAGSTDQKLRVLPGIRTDDCVASVVRRTERRRPLSDIRFGDVLVGITRLVHLNRERQRREADLVLCRWHTRPQISRGIDADPRFARQIGEGKGTGRGVGSHRARAVRDPRRTGGADRIVRAVVNDVPMHLNAIEPAPDEGGQHEKKYWDERGKAVPREGSDQLIPKRLP